MQSTKSAAAAKAAPKGKTMSAVPLCRLECNMSFDDKQDRPIRRSQTLILRHNPEKNEIETYHKTKGYLIGSLYGCVNTALIPLLNRDDVKTDCKITEDLSFIMVEITIHCTDEAVPELLPYVENLRAHPEGNHMTLTDIKFNFIRKLHADADTDTSGCESVSDTDTDEMMKQTISQMYKKVMSDMSTASNKKQKSVSKSTEAAAKKAETAASAKTSKALGSPKIKKTDIKKSTTEIAEMTKTSREDRQTKWGRLLCAVETHITGLANYPGYAEIDDFMALIPEMGTKTRRHTVWVINSQEQIVGSLPQPLSHEVAPIISKGIGFCTLLATAAATKTRQYADLYVYYKEGSLPTSLEMHTQWRFIQQSMASIPLPRLTDLFALPGQPAPPLNVNDVNRPDEVIIGTSMAWINGNLSRRDVILEGVMRTRARRDGDQHKYRVFALDSNGDEFGYITDRLAERIGAYMNKGRLRCFGALSGGDQYGNPQIRIVYLLKKEHVKYRNKIRDIASGQCNFNAIDFLPATPMTVGNVLKVPGYRDTDIDVEAVFGPSRSQTLNVAHAPTASTRTNDQSGESNSAGKKRARSS
jgi:hypothetical protein